MDSINRLQIVEQLNNYAFGEDISPVLDNLNILLNSEKYSENLDLIYMSIASTQMYGFLSYLTEEEQNRFFESDYLRSFSYKGKEIPFYNRGQLSFLHELEQFQKVFFSAPTSFGKTSIVTEYILNNYNNLNNILFVVPTNSLLEELFNKYTIYNAKLKLKYNISTQPVFPLTGRNVLFLTPERFMIIAENENLNKYDLIVMDETYKIVDAHNGCISDFVNHRSVRFRKVADLIAKADTRVIFLSPFTYTLTDSMKCFLSKHNIKKIDRKIEYVKREIIKISGSADTIDTFGQKINNYQKSNSIPKKTNLILNQLFPQSTIVYVSNYSKAYEIAEAINTPFDHIDNPRYKAFMDHLKNNYLVDENKWAVYEALKKGVGIYIAPLPRYIKKEIIKLYEEKVLSTLIVTSAFTEGVNTCASNLIFTSLINGPTTNKLSDIDVLNVAGRAGRFAQNTIGKIYCISDEVYNSVNDLQHKNDIKLENYNYIKMNPKLDFEIEMMDDEYLDDEQKEEKQLLNIEMLKLGLKNTDLNISLNVSKQWKLILYKHFLSQDKQTLNFSGKAIEQIFEHIQGKRVNAMAYIFNDLKKAFENSDENVFPQESYDIYPFDNSEEFTWGRLYQIYVSDSPKKIIKNNIQYITKKYNDIKGIMFTKEKKYLEPVFAKNNASWVLKYYNQNLTLNMNVFYTETFKIVSNIIQYKLPFYLTFYVSIFKLFVSKNPNKYTGDINYDINKLINIFEDGEIIEDYEKLTDYGLPISTVRKIAETKISMEKLKLLSYDSTKFDDYENIILKETLPLI